MLLTEADLRQVVQHNIAESIVQLKDIPIHVGNKSINVEVADNEDSRNIGMMFRRVLPPEKGMLFVFEDSAPRRFWMKNTYVPLSIAYINSRGIILNVEKMNPLSESGVWSKGPARYALEMNQGWFKENGISPGDLVKIYR
tara:strand:- start:6435 stop:6857 length:423 start_codon:yes stop_codon:yes gene_type:complete